MKPSEPQNITMPSLGNGWATFAGVVVGIGVIALIASMALTGCVDPLFKAPPRTVGVTNIGNVPPHLRSGDAKSEAKPAVAPGAVSDAPKPPDGEKTEAQKPPPTQATTGTARNPIYGLWIIGILVVTGGAVLITRMILNKRKASKPKTNPPPETP